MPRAKKYYTVEDIIAYRCREGNEEFQVSWLGYSADHNTWINALEIPPFFKDRAYKKKEETLQQQQGIETLSRVAERELYSIQDSMALVRKDQALILVSQTTQGLPGDDRIRAVRARVPGSFKTFLIYMDKCTVPPLPME